MHNISRKVTFTIPFFGVIIAVICQIGIFGYVHTTGISVPVVPPFEWYYHIGGIIAVAFISAVLVVVEKSKVMKKALSVLFLSVVSLLLNVRFFFTSPELFFSNLLLTCLLSAFAWSIFRRAQDGITQ